MKLIREFSSFTLALAGSFVFAATSTGLAQNAAVQNSPGQGSPAPESHGIAVANMDRAVKPGDDFYNYANGEWARRTEIPPDRPAVGTFSRLSDLSIKNTIALVEEMAKSNPPAGSNARKIADLYNSYLDEAGIEKRGLDPLRPHLEAIAAIRDKRELARALGETLRADVDALNNTNFHTANLFGLWVAPGFKDSDHYAAYLMQGGLELADREYYLAGDDRMRGIRTKYQAHVAAMLKLAGFSEPDARAGRIIDLEQAIAKTHRSLEENEDIHKADNTWTQADFPAKAPGLDWSEYFHAAGLAQQPTFIVWQPEAFAGESALVASTALDTWKDWLAYHLVESYAGVLPKALADENFAFFSTTLYGMTQQRPRGQRGAFVVNGLLGDAVGQVYVQHYFSPQAKAEAEAMVANLIAAYRKRLESITWMEPATKAEAQAKLSTLYIGVGYPDSWTDYSSYEVKADDIVGNFWRGRLFQFTRAVSRLGKPVDRKEWVLTPQTVNAVNLPLHNSLNFPAAILQPPFFDAKAPAAANYGAIGAVIGHEISHTFDTEGSAFDSKGRVRNWWTPADLAHFNAVTARLAAQYDTYKPFPDVSVNGKQTLPENIADVAGLSAAYDGYQASLGGKVAPVEEGFSGDQQFFIAWGQAWGTREMEASFRQSLMTDTHAPYQYRAATVRNLDAWYKAFDVKPGEKLYLDPPERVRIW